MRSKNSFRKLYIIFTGVLILAMIICFIRVGSLLKKYEACQPENTAVRLVEQMKKGAKKGSLEAFSKENGLEGESADFINSKADVIKSSEGDVTAKLVKTTDGGETMTYTVFAGDTRLMDLSLTARSEETALLLFTMTDWQITGASEATYYDAVLPATVEVISGGNLLSGDTDVESGRTSYYFPLSVDHSKILIRDSFGREVPFTDKPVVKEYDITIPSNYKITSKDGSITVPLDRAVQYEIDDYKYVSQYTDMPKMATYRLGIIGAEPDFNITDNLGKTVDYEMSGRKLKIESQASLEIVPEDIYSAEDILSHGKTWSLFMTADLGGAKHGFAQVEEFLLPDSYLEDVAHKWATGVDITFTSVHTLDNPPFSVAKVSGFVKYSDICFSADVMLTKIMHLNSGADVTDTMNCRFYYVQKDGNWYVCDIQEIIE